MVGELAWFVTRCRPDLMFSTAKLAAAKNPKAVVEAGEHVWAYLAGTANDGPNFPAPLLDEDLMMNVYTDPLFGITGRGRTLICWGESSFLWKSARHATMSNSTAEAELMELIDAATAGDAVRVVIEELIDGRAKAIAFTDNASALAIATGETGARRTRHLRRRTLNLRWRVCRGDWAVRIGQAYSWRHHAS